MCNKRKFNNKNQFECYTTTAHLVHNKKKRKTQHMSSISLGWLHTRKGSTKIKHLKRIKILFDTGCDTTIINKQFVSKLRTKRIPQATGIPKVVCSKQKEQLMIFFLCLSFLNTGKSSGLCI